MNAEMLDSISPHQEETSPMLEKFLLAIPVFNEAQYVRGVLRKARRYCREILVIDDGSSDATAELLGREKGVHVLTHSENRGYGSSLADAFAFAQTHGFDWLITMDCDEQHQPSCIPSFLIEARRDDADVISGTRFPSGSDGDGTAPPERREINRRISAILNNRLGLHLTDAFCGFKAYRVAALSAIAITVPGYAMPMQFWVQASRANLRIREHPVPLIYNDPNRFFGGTLDDPAVRLTHYLEVFEAELKALSGAPTQERVGCLSCP